LSGFVSAQKSHVHLYRQTINTFATSKINFGWLNNAVVNTLPRDLFSNGILFMACAILLNFSSEKLNMPSLILLNITCLFPKARGDQEMLL